MCGGYKFYTVIHFHWKTDKRRILMQIYTPIFLNINVFVRQVSKCAVLWLYLVLLHFCFHVIKLTAAWDMHLEIIMMHLTLFCCTIKIFITKQNTVCYYLLVSLSHQFSEFQCNFFILFCQLILQCGLESFHQWLKSRES